VREAGKWSLAAVLMLALAFGYSNASGAGGRIVCWKDKSGKVVGCGDTVPPEYRDNATKELDKRGVTRKTTVSADEAARRKAQETELAKQKAEEERKIAEQRRQDAALLGTFFSLQEIDQKRDRDLQQVELRIDELQASLKKARTDQQKQKIQQTIAAENREKEEVRQKYAGYRKRYIELKGTGESAARAPAATNSKK